MTIYQTNVDEEFQVGYLVFQSRDVVYWLYVDWNFMITRDDARPFAVDLVLLLLNLHVGTNSQSYENSHNDFKLNEELALHSIFKIRPV